MYIPKNYNHTRAIELGNLVDEAYCQYDSFVNDQVWTIKHPYLLLTEITMQSKYYDLFDKSESRVSRIKKLFKPNNENKYEIPIGFIAEKDNAVYLVFRGTKTALEWVNNLQVKMDVYQEIDSGKIHEGFLNIYQSIRDSFLSFIKDINKSKKIYITGHSLGGALASIAAIDITKNLDRTISGIYTFGSPKIGDKIFTQEYNKKFNRNSFRIVNTCDIITEFPFSIPIVGVIGGYYTHVNNPVVFTDQKEDIENNHDIKEYISYLQAQYKYLNPIKKIIEKIV